jgi:hypothetical protein
MSQPCRRNIICLALAVLPIAALAQQPAISPSSTPARSVRISFVPPPLEGTISLGIYDENDQLVRVLHQEASLDEFTTGADALVTKWDGKDDFGYDLWPGTYHARGFLVAAMKIVSSAATADALDSAPIKIKLAPNPLAKNERPTVELTAAIDDGEVLLKTADGLPLLTIAEAPDALSVALAADREHKNAIVSVHASSGDRRFSISGLDQMMEFDCGEFELK